jgi:serine/threonine protein kinase
LKRYNPSELFIDLVEKTLVFDPLKRIKPAQALTHPFFADLCTDQKYLEGIKKLPYLFDWSRNPKL